MSALPGRAPLSAVVTTFDNAATLDDCLASLAFCDELIVLDSASSDDTRGIAERHRATVFIEPFKGYGLQKQSAIDKAAYDWVLLLDADEHLTPAGRECIERELLAPRADGYRLPRQEWLFWRWPHPATRPNLVEHKRAKRPALLGLRMLLYPSIAFAKLYIGKRYFLNGWAGFFAAKTQAFYAFLKYAKLHEAMRQHDDP